MLGIIILIVLCILLYIYYKHAKKLKFDTLVMINGGVGTGKSSTTIWQGVKTHKRTHAIWWRRTHIYSKLPFKKCKSMALEEEPLLYCNIPIYKNYKKDIIYKYYRPLTTEHLLRTKRFNFKSTIIIDESSLIANSMSGKYGKDNPMAQTINEQLTLFIKLIRHELHGSYKNFLFKNNANVFINTQSKNDNHFAFDRAINQVFYITKSLTIPFFRIVWCRELLLIDSVENNFDDDIKESNSKTRWYLISKKVFNMYDSYAYSMLTDDKEIINNISEYIILSGRFEIPTLTQFKEIQENNTIFNEYVKIKEKEKEQNGQQETI